MTDLSPFADLPTDRPGHEGSPFTPAVTPRPDEPLPRLSIQHLMAWTAATALYLGVGRVVWSDSLATNKDDPLSMFLWVAWAPVCGAYMAGFLLFLARRLRGRHWLLHPGDWLFVIFGLGVWLQLVASGLIHGLLAAPEGRDRLAFYQVMTIVFFAVRFCEAVAAAVASRYLKAWPTWRRFFWFAAIYLLLLSGWLRLPAMSTGLSWVAWYLASPILFSLVATIVAVIDWRRGTCRPWTHWSAIGIEAITGVLHGASLVHYLIRYGR